MNFKTVEKRVQWIGLGLLILLAVACGGAEEVPTPAPTLAVPTEPPALEVVVTETVPPEPTAVPTSIATDTAATTPTDVPTATAVPATNTPIANSNNQPASYAVVFVETNDVLNMRSGPGVDFGVVAPCHPMPPTCRLPAAARW